MIPREILLLSDAELLLVLDTAREVVASDRQIFIMQLAAELRREPDIRLAIERVRLKGPGGPAHIVGAWGAE
jgi:hypothetical protein